jgi:hypothetical protein
MSFVSALPIVLLGITGIVGLIISLVVIIVLVMLIGWFKDVLQLPLNIVKGKLRL